MHKGPQKTIKTIKKQSKIKFPSVSVGATENALLAAFGAKGKTILSNCAIEPEIKDLILFLKKWRNNKVKLFKFRNYWFTRKKF